MENPTWIMCPVCKGKTRTRMRSDTVIKLLPLYCPKCKQESLVNIKQKRITVIGKSDAETQC